MKKTIIALLVLIIFLAGCSGMTGPVEPVYNDVPESDSGREPIQVHVPDSPAQNEVSFPGNIGKYALENRRDEPTRCQTFEKGMKDVEGNVLDIEGEACSRATILRYVDESIDKVIFVHLGKFTEGKDVQKKLMLEVYPTMYPGRIQRVEGTNVYRMERHELFWFSDSEECGQVVIQEGEKEDRPDGSTSYRYPYTASMDNEVTQYFLERYPVEG